MTVEGSATVYTSCSSEIWTTNSHTLHDLVAVDAPKVLVLTPLEQVEHEGLYSLGCERSERTVVVDRVLSLIGQLLEI